MARKMLISWIAIFTSIVFAGAAESPKNLLKPTPKIESWRFEQHESAKGKMSAEADAIVFEVTESDGTDWHLQAFQTGLDLKDGKEYVITFKAKALADRSILVNAGIDQDDWHMVGLTETVELQKDWKDFKFEFKADQTVAGKNRIGFVMGTEKGKIWVKEVVLTQK